MQKSRPLIGRFFASRKAAAVDKRTRRRQIMWHKGRSDEPPFVNPQFSKFGY
jgi:hypothetical protein